jgi:hypothetical protein
MAKSAPRYFEKEKPQTTRISNRFYGFVLIRENSRLDFSPDLRSSTQICG